MIEAHKGLNEINKKFNQKFVFFFLNSKIGKLSPYSHSPFNMKLRVSHFIQLPQHQFVLILVILFSKINGIYRNNTAFSSATLVQWRTILIWTLPLECRCIPRIRVELLAAGDDQTFSWSQFLCKQFANQ